MASSIEVTPTVARFAVSTGSFQDVGTLRRRVADDAENGVVSLPATLRQERSILTTSAGDERAFHVQNYLSSKTP
jgi:hypothetical protein